MSAVPNPIPIGHSTIDWDQWFRIDVAAQRMGRDESGVRRRCRDEWQQQGLAALMTPPGGGHQSWFVHRDADRRLMPGGIGELHREPDLSAFSERQRQGALTRRKCVEMLGEARMKRPGMMKDWMGALLDEMRAKFPELSISESRLRTWERMYRRPADLLKLVDQRGGATTEPASPEAWQMFKELYLHENSPSLRHCWERVKDDAEKNGWTWYGEGACRAQLNKRIPRELQLRYRNPAAWRQKLRPYIAQAPEAWGIGERWVGDHRQHDLWCTYRGTIIRPWITAWIDWRSRRLCGHVLSAAPNSSTILAALHQGLKDERNMGGPDEVAIDNGKDYDAWVFHGQTKQERRARLDVRVDELGSDGIFRALGIEAHFSIPHNPNGKSRMERWFRTLGEFDKLFPTYAGNSPENRPENLAKVLATPHLIPSFETVKTRLAAFIEGDNANRDHDIDDLVFDGVRLSSDEAMARCERRRVLADPNAIELLMMQWHKPVTVGRNGIALFLAGKKYSYGNNAPELTVYKADRLKDRRSLRVSYDPNDLRKIRVYDEHWRFIGTIPMNLEGGIRGNDPISLENAKAVRRANAEYLKATSHAVKNHLTQTLTTEEQIAEEAAKSARPVATPSALSIVRTPLDGQAAAVERAESRKVVGAESTGPAAMHMGLEALAILAAQQQARPAARQEEDEFEIDPWAALRRKQ